MNFMSPWICRVFWKAFWVGLLGAFSGLRSEEAAVRAVWNDSAVRISLVGSAREDWFLESSTRLTNWVREPGAPPLVAGPAGGPERTIPLADGRTDRFFRAVRTDGLFDKTFLRTFHLRFQQADWNESLVKAHGTDSNVVCRLESEHGQVLDGVGARYKGYSSFAPDRTKNSLNLTLDFLNPTNRLLGYETVNLNNAWGDPTLLREAIYFGVFTRYAPGPRAGIARLFINGENRGVYSLAQQEDSDLIREWFPSASGDRWRTPNKGASSLQWISTNLVDYQGWYELKTTANATNAWRRLMQAIEVLNHTPRAQRLGVLDGYFAVDSWLWFLVLENLFVEDDSYWHKGADYSFYFEPESGRIHPLQHDGNEAFVSSFAQLSPVYGEADLERPLLSQLLSVPEWRQRYLAHMRTVLDESFNPGCAHAMDRSTGRDERSGHPGRSHPPDERSGVPGWAQGTEAIRHQSIFLPQATCRVECGSPGDPVGVVAATAHARHRGGDHGNGSGRHAGSTCRPGVAALPPGGCRAV